MKAPEMTEELRNDIKVIRMRSTLDPKRFYKSNDMAAIPKFVQVCIYIVTVCNVMSRFLIVQTI